MRRAPATLRQPSAPQAIAAKLLGLHTVTNSESSFPYLHSYLCPTICSSAPHGGPPPRPPAFNWTLFRLAIRPSTALASHETVLGSAVPSPATPPAPCCFQIIRSGLQQVRFLRKLMPGEGFYMNVLWCIIKAWKRCAVPAAIASCCHESICAFVASRPALTRY